MKIKKLLALTLIAALAITSVFAGGSSESTATASSSGRPVLRVAMECAYAPYNWTQPTDANGAVPIADSNDYAFGYDVMMAKLIAERLGYDLEIVRLDWDSLVPAVQSGVVDCVIAGQSITSERLQMVDFTKPYYYASIVCVADKNGPYADAKGVQDLRGAVCTSQISTVWYDVCLPQIPDARILPAQETAPAMLVALNSGRCDIVCTDMPTAQAALMVYPNMTLLDFTGSDDNFLVSEEEINIGISIRKGNTELLNAINGVLDTLTVDDYNRMMDEAIQVQPLNQ